ncbi:outer membrane protein assembly factor BamE [Dokdonella sp.]|uniref:outer membrane protein assembly factor BamE n=1 Tax=Dokdonella sp. TaxID=2291710 RepID=UPI0031C2223A|nr:outer membrane protein assembly factor BamE [Dokdonella sp.]
MRFCWILLLAALSLGGCGLIYRVDTQQGNLLDKAQVESLKPGMSKRQVLLVMGSPSIISPFDQDRWDYVSTLREGRNKMDTRDLTLHFEDGFLARIEGDYFAEDPKQLMLEARKYKRAYPDEKRPDEKKRSGQG